MKFYNDLSIGTIVLQHDNSCIHIGICDLYCGGNIIIRVSINNHTLSIKTRNTKSYNIFNDDIVIKI